MPKRIGPLPINHSIESFRAYRREWMGKHSGYKPLRWMAALMDGCCVECAADLRIDGDPSGSHFLTRLRFHVYRHFKTIHPETTGNHFPEMGLPVGTKLNVPYPWPFSETELRADYYDLKMSRSEIGEKYGISASAVQRAMIKFRIIGRREGSSGPKNGNWLGDKAQYGACHERVSRLRGKPRRCEECNTADPLKRYHWANLTGNYHDVNDYRRLCAKCHRLFDLSEPSKSNKFYLRRSAAMEAR